MDGNAREWERADRGLRKRDFLAVFPRFNKLWYLWPIYWAENGVPHAIPRSPVVSHLNRH
jgi:hypothetical protein